MALLIVTALFLLAIAGAAFIRRGSTSAAASSKSGGGSGHSRPPPNGSFIDFVKNSWQVLDWTTSLIATSPTATASSFMGILTANPNVVEHILKDKFENYPKGARSTDILADFLGSGIFNSDGEIWRMQRKTASLEFSTKTIRTFVMSNVRLEAVSRLLPALGSASASSQTIDLLDLLERFAFDNVCQVAFGHDPARLAIGDTDPDSVEFFRAFERASELCVARYTYPWPVIWKLLRWLGRGTEGQLRKEIATVHAFASRIVRLRKQTMKREAKPPGDDLLSRFLSDKEEYADEFLRDIIISFVLAGRDTTSATLAWFFWLISTRPAVEARVLSEINSARARLGKSREQEPVLSLDELRGMEYLHAALSETLRLYPPVPLQSRSCVVADVLPDGTPVAAGQMVMYSSYAMGRSEQIWGPDCLEFRPERWLDDKGGFRAASPFRFPVFHAGPRMCLGKDMAYIQMKAVAAAVLERFVIDVVDKEKQRELDFLMILKIKGGLPIKVRERLPAVAAPA